MLSLTHKGPKIKDKLIIKHNFKLKKNLIWFRSLIIAMVVHNHKLVFDPFETAAKGGFELSFDGEHVVGSYPFSPFDLWVTTITGQNITSFAVWTVEAVRCGPILESSPDVLIRTGEGFAFLHVPIYKNASHFTGSWTGQRLCLTMIPNLKKATICS